MTNQNNDAKKAMDSWMQPLVVTSDGKTFYANRNHPYWNDKSWSDDYGRNGNPYLPLNSKGNMQKGYVG